MKEQAGARIHINGIVQGVGFRPFVYGLATHLGITGWVRNTSAGVDVEANGSKEDLKSFLEALVAQAPPLARIDEVLVEDCLPDSFTDFEILESEPISGAFQPISPDVSICPDCLHELFDPQDRRYRYPFINCTNCGPRFTIIADIPYDRPKTTMAGFPMCPDCAAEYHDPADRRFHAQPVACPECGPQIWLELATKASLSREVETEPDQPPDAYLAYRAVSRADAALIQAQKMLSEGRILAIKGLGGFHLACDATNRSAVEELRRRKLRVDKPFALMMPDVAAVRRHCFLDEQEQALLESRQRPIVILRRRPDSAISTLVAPEQDTLGVMLPYTPLHYLLFSAPPGEDSLKDVPQALVMTSGNLSEEPIATGNEEARCRLSVLADAFLMHDRPIHTRCDDSVMRLEKSASSENSRLLPIRRSRGYAPFPVRLPWESGRVLAGGAELKNAFCLTRDRYAFLSHHIGDLENYETLQSFEQGITYFERLFRVQPQVLAYDLHPNYLATRYILQRAESEGLPAIGIQHHIAHVAACMAENNLPGDRRVIGVAFDGTGYGEDEAIWGGEFFLANYDGALRVAHLSYVPLPGGDAAVRQPARTALSYLSSAGLEWSSDLPSVAEFSLEERDLLRQQIERNLNAPPTSSMGRLFDAVAALAGVRQKVNYEAQAAIELEALADPQEKEAYPFSFYSGPAGTAMQIETSPLIVAVTQDMLQGLPASRISARFHHGVANMVLQVCTLVRDKYGSTEVALSGGVWQNVLLLSNTARLLKEAGFTVYTHHLVPPNDGGLALGQAILASRWLQKNENQWAR